MLPTYVKQHLILLGYQFYYPPTVLLKMFCVDVLWNCLKSKNICRFYMKPKKRVILSLFSSLSIIINSNQFLCKVLLFTCYMLYWHFDFKCIPWKMFFYSLKHMKEMTLVWDDMNTFWYIWDAQPYPSEEARG